MGSLDLSSLPQDMTREEREQLAAYIGNGLPGILRIQQGDVFKLFELYMAGKTYAEIATITKFQKDIILYLAYKSRWLDHRMKHYEDISLNILEKVKQVRMDSANNLIAMTQALGQYLGQRYNKYLSTKDSNVIEGIDKKISDQYFKALDLMDKILNTDGENPNKQIKQQTPLVSINMGSSNATVKQVDEKTLEISDQTAGELLKSLAELKKSTEK